MIIRQDKTYETCSLYPNTDWYSKEENLIIDETTEEGLLMAQTYIENYPFIDFEHDGKFISKVIVLDRPERPPEVEGKEIQLIKNELNEWEYIYVDIPLRKEQELEQKIQQQNAVIEEILFSIIPSILEV